MGKRTLRLEEQYEVLNPVFEESKFILQSLTKKLRRQFRGRFYYNLGMDIFGSICFPRE